MSKDGNATLYGIRFNQDEGKDNAQCQWLLPPLAWLNKDNEWYLVEFFTPKYLVNQFPNLITHYPHRAWKVSKEVVDNPVFRLNEYNSGSKDSSGSFWELAVAVPVGISLPPVLTKISAMLFPVTGFPGYWLAVLESFISMLITLTLVGLYFKIFQHHFEQKYYKKISNFNELSNTINEIKDNNQKVSIDIDKSNAYEIYPMMMKLLLATFFGVFLFWLFIFVHNNETTNIIIFHGIMTGVAISLCFYFSFFSLCMRFKGVKGNLGKSFKTNVKDINPLKINERSTE